MKLAVITLAAAAGALATAALATGAIAASESPLGPAPASGTGLASGQCVRTHDIRSHTIADKKTMLISTGKDVYRLTMNGSCLAGAVSSDPIVTRSPPGSSIACKPIDFDIAVSKGGFGSRCIVDSVVKLAPQEVAALPPKLRP
jgi:hypothetical protein